ncbi:MAG: hypothetical protein ABSF26_25400 [Thermoguttaceae bacterium]|jgi:hypothetical protein
MKRNRLALIAFAATLLMIPPAALNAAERKPLLWAVYYAWYETAAGPHGRWSQWSDDKSANSNPKPKSRAQPLIGYYDSDDPGVVRWHIRLAKAAGIDAFLTSWWGDANISGAAFEKTILPVAAEEHFKVALCSELAQFHHDVKVLSRQMADVLRRTKDNPAYLRVDGKPLVYLYQVPFAPKLTPATFGQLRDGVEGDNEWPETTIVEPSSSWPDPYRYLRIVAEWKGVAFTPPSTIHRLGFTLGDGPDGHNLIDNVQSECVK